MIVLTTQNNAHTVLHYNICCCCFAFLQWTVTLFDIKTMKRDKQLILLYCADCDHVLNISLVNWYKADSLHACSEQTRRDQSLDVRWHLPLSIRVLSQWLCRWVTTQYRSDQSPDVRWHLLLSIIMLSQGLRRWVTTQYRSDQSNDVRQHLQLSIRMLSQGLYRW